MTLRGLKATLAIDVSVLWGLYRLSVSTGSSAAGRVGRRRPSRKGAAFPGGVRGMLKHATCERFTCRLALGTGDAASTGVLVGMAWAIVGLALSLARANVGRWQCVPAVSVIPSFYSEVLEGDLECVLVVRAWHAALAVAGIALSQGRRCCDHRVQAAG